MIVEGVEYHRYRVSFRLTDGRRVRWVRWAPAALYAFEAIQRECEARFSDSELGQTVNLHLRAMDRIKEELARARKDAEGSP